jgi:hypothetical protein
MHHGRTEQEATMDSHVKYDDPDRRIAAIEIGLIATGACVVLATSALTLWAWVFI